MEQVHVNKLQGKTSKQIASHGQDSREKYTQTGLRDLFCKINLVSLRDHVEIQQQLVHSTLVEDSRSKGKILTLQSILKTKSAINWQWSTKTGPGNGLLRRWWTRGAKNASLLTFFRIMMFSASTYTEYYWSALPNICKYSSEISWPWPLSVLQSWEHFFQCRIIP